MSGAKLAVTVPRFFLSEGRFLKIFGCVLGCIDNIEKYFFISDVGGSLAEYLCKSSDYLRPLSFDTPHSFIH